MKTVSDPVVLRSLTDRLRRLRPEDARRFGTLTPHEMLCHLGDAAEMVLLIRPRTVPVAPHRRPIRKAFLIWTAVPWPHGVKTNPRHDPRAEGTRPSDFESDRARAISSLEGIAAAGPGSLEPAHGIMGSMTSRDWQRWAYRHTDYHLRQFGQ
jgi:hypothetical protein